uniref:Uncharacterized protein n=1 Tax=Oryza meridionalis TaxID=40149 RepID=A0A0E0C551_9ORYZ
MALLPAEVDGGDRGWLCAMDTYTSCCVPLPSKEVDAVKKRGIRRATEMERKASRPVAGEEAAGDRQERGRAALRRRRRRQPDEEKEAAKDGETRWQPDAGEILVVDVEVTEGLDDGGEVDGNGGVLANGARRRGHRWRGRGGELDILDLTGGVRGSRARARGRQAAPSFPGSHLTPHVIDDISYSGGSATAFEESGASIAPITVDLTSIVKSLRDLDVDR